jgi:hypoxanthine phosphoribosyltransferase
VDVPIAYVGFEIGDEFVVGYGLDYRQQYRNLPFIATIAPAVEETDAGEPAADPQVATLEG